MKFKKLKHDKIKNNIIKDTLKSGVIPDSFEINKKINEKLSTDKELLRTKPYSVEEHSKSDSKAYNDFFEGLKEDLDLAYDINRFNTENIIKLYESYSVETEKIKRELDKINTRKANIQRAMASIKIHSNKFIAFDNLYNVELDGIKDKNIPKTTSYIDLDTVSIQNPVLKNTLKYDISKAKITVNSDFDYKNIVFSDNPESILNDSFDENAIYKITMPNDMPITLEFTVKLDKAVSANTVTLNYSDAFNSSASLYVSSDETNYTKFKEYSGKNKIKWNFNLRPIKSIKFFITKKCSDSKTQNGYEYYFFVNNISVLKNQYEKKSVFVTKPIEYDSFVNDIKIIADEEKSATNSIQYFLGIERENKMNWIPAGLNSPNKLYESTDVRKIISGEELLRSGNTINILKLKDNYNMNSLNIIPAYQMWKIETFTVRKNINHIPTLEDYKMTNLKERKYISTNEYTLSLKGHTMAVLSLYIYCSEDASIGDRAINAYDYSVNSRIFLNNAEINPINNKYILKLKKGKNVFNMLIYCPAVKEEDINKEHIVSHNFYFKDITFNVFGESHMTYVGKDSLISKTSDLKYYSIDENNNLIIKNSNIALTDIKYLVSYKYTDIEDKKITIRAMAVLTSDDINTTPKINSLSLIGE